MENYSPVIFSELATDLQRKIGRPLFERLALKTDLQKVLKDKAVKSGGNPRCFNYPPDPNTHGYTAAVCCNPWDIGGNFKCWEGMFTFEFCCPNNPDNIKKEGNTNVVFYTDEEKIQIHEESNTNTLDYPSVFSGDGPLVSKILSEDLEYKHFESFLDYANTTYSTEYTDSGETNSLFLRDLKIGYFGMYFYSNVQWKEKIDKQQKSSVVKTYFFGQPWKEELKTGKIIDVLDSPENKKDSTTAITNDKEFTKFNQDFVSEVWASFWRQVLLALDFAGSELLGIFERIKSTFKILSITSTDSNISGSTRKILTLKLLNFLEQAVQYHLHGNPHFAHREAHVGDFVKNVPANLVGNSFMERVYENTMISHEWNGDKKGSSSEENDKLNAHKYMPVGIGVTKEYWKEEMRKLLSSQADREKNNNETKKSRMLSELCENLGDKEALETRILDIKSEITNIPKWTTRSTTAQRQMIYEGRAFLAKVKAALCGLSPETIKTIPDADILKTGGFTFSESQVNTLEEQKENMLEFVRIGKHRENKNDSNLSNNSISNSNIIDLLQSLYLPFTQDAASYADWNAFHLKQDGTQIGARIIYILGSIEAEHNRCRLLSECESWRWYEKKEVPKNNSNTKSKNSQEMSPYNSRVDFNLVLSPNQAEFRMSADSGYKTPSHKIDDKPHFVNLDFVERKFLKDLNGKDFKDHRPYLEAEVKNREEKKQDARMVQPNIPVIDTFFTKKPDGWARSDMDPNAMRAQEVQIDLVAWP